MTAKSNGFFSVLLCGPIDFNNLDKSQKIFKVYEDLLKEEGLRPVSPIELIKIKRKKNRQKVELVVLSDTAWSDFCDCTNCFNLLPFCDAIYLMPNWNKDSQAMALALMANSLGLILIAHNNDGSLISVNLLVSELIKNESSSREEHILYCAEENEGDDGDENDDDDSDDEDLEDQTMKGQPKAQQEQPPVDPELEKWLERQMKMNF